MGILTDKDCSGCMEYREMTRRRFLDRVRTATAAAVTAPVWLPNVVFAQDENSDRDVLVVVFLRGGMDGLTSVVPFGDQYYNLALRPTLFIDEPGQPNGAVDLDGFFGLAPAMAPLLPAYQSGQLAIVHATGSTDPTRSHFDAVSYMEYGIPEQPLDVFTGWIARHLQTSTPTGNGLLRALAVSDLLPKSLSGAPAALPTADPSNFSFPGSPLTELDRSAAVASAYATADDPLPASAQSTLATIELLETIDFVNYTPTGGAVYPGSTFGQSMRSVAALIKNDVGVEVATVDLGGWDHHNQQGALNGSMANLMDTLSSSLAAFHLDMQTHMKSLTLLVMSEFGRRADENGSFGTDHGHGNVMFVMGGSIAGNQVHADWTGGELLHPNLLYGGDSLDITTDYRDVVAEIVQNRLGNTNLSEIFPNYTPSFIGITQ